LDSLIYRALYESLYTADLRIEVNYVLQDKASMNSTLNKLNAKPLRRYRIYRESSEPRRRGETARSFPGAMSRPHRLIGPVAHGHSLPQLLHV
jgi:hypothetical protein